MPRAAIASLRLSLSEAAAARGMAARERERPW
jgi:hypothetical protein